MSDSIANPFEGLTTKSPEASDASTKVNMKGASVDDGAGRKTVAPTPKSLGPRYY